MGDERELRRGKSKVLCESRILNSRANEKWFNRKGT